MTEVSSDEYSKPTSTLSLSKISAKSQRVHGEDNSMRNITKTQYENKSRDNAPACLNVQASRHFNHRRAIPQRATTARPLLFGIAKTASTEEKQQYGTTIGTVIPKPKRISRAITWKHLDNQWSEKRYTKLQF